MIISDITPDYLREVYMFGIDLTDPEGNPFPDVMYKKAIDAAKQWLHVELHMYFEETLIENEVHDYRKTDWMDWMYIRTYWYPIIDVEKITATFPAGNEIIDFPKDWMVIHKRPGQVQMVPTLGSMSSFLIGQGGQLLSMYAHLHSFIPGMFKITYKTGFENDDIPEDCADLICKKACTHVLHNAGDMIAGSAGVANFSVSVDGMSQSLGTTASPTNAGYGARLLNWRSEIKQQLKELKDYWNGFKLVVL